jgi:hypothetical protein
MSEEIRKEPLTDKMKIALLESALKNQDTSLRKMSLDFELLRADYIENMNSRQTLLKIIAFLSESCFPVKTIETGKSTFELRAPITDLLKRIEANHFVDIRIETSADESQKNLKIHVVIDEIVSPKQEETSTEEIKKVIPIIHNG